MSAKRKRKYSHEEMSILNICLKDISLFRLVLDFLFLISSVGTSVLRTLSPRRHGFFRNSEFSAVVIHNVYIKIVSPFLDKIRCIFLQAFPVIS